VQFKSVVVLGTALAVASIGATACASKKSNTGSSGGGGSKTLIISTDLPMQGSSQSTSEATVNMIKLYLDSIGNKVTADNGTTYNLQLKTYDDSTAAKGKWDEAQCTKNAAEHVATQNEVAVMGTYNSGCAKIIVPTLNQDPNGPMLMISHANTSPGLTKKDSQNDPGEPDKYYPTGKRNYGRVVATDDFQGSGGAALAKDLGIKKCYVLDDNETYGQGIAKYFMADAPADGVQIVGHQAWDAKQTSYTALFNTIKALNPDCVYLGGIFDNNGGQLVKDKVAVLGDNTKVKLLGPDGFTGYPDLDKLAQADGMYLTTPAVPASVLSKQGGKPAQLLDAYKAKYGSTPPNYALYGTAAVQVMIEAIKKSDGTRKGVWSAVFSGAGVTVAAADSAIGAEVHLDPATGDPAVKSMNIEKIVNGDETLLKSQAVG